MGWFSHVSRVARNVARNPIKAVAKVVHNPTAAILNKSVRSSRGFKKFARPAIKIGAGIAIGSVTGGIGLAGFTGLSTAGAAAGGLASIAGGGFSSRAFSPLRNVVFPAAAGAAAGAFTRLSAVQKAALNPFSSAGSSAAGSSAAAGTGTAGTAASGGFFSTAATTTLSTVASQTALGLLSGGQQQPQDTFAIDPAAQFDSGVYDIFGNWVDPATADPNGTYYDAGGNQVQIASQSQNQGGAGPFSKLQKQLPQQIDSFLASNNVNKNWLLIGAVAGGLKGGATGAVIGALVGAYLSQQNNKSNTVTAAA